MVISDLDRVLILAGSVVEAPQWPREEYERILLPNPDRLVDRFAFIAETTDALAGLAIAGLIQGEDVAELETIVVGPMHRRFGLGTQLLSSSMAAAAQAGAAAMFLEVRESNSAAIALYRRTGFREAGRRTAYYRDPVEDALLFRAQLPVVFPPPVVPPEDLV